MSWHSVETLSNKVDEGASPVVTEKVTEATDSLAPPLISPASSPVFMPGFGRDYSLGSIAILLGRSYSAAQMLEAQAILTYVKNHGLKSLPDLRFSDVRQTREAVQNTRLIEALSRGRKWALKRLAERLAPWFVKDLVIAVVPSHDPWQEQTPIRDLAQQIATLADMTDGTGCLVRHTKITRIVFGGPSTSALHRQTVNVQDAGIFEGRQVLLLDDIAKSGCSLVACRALLYEAGAAVVQAAALGRVIGGNVASYPD